MYFDGDYFFGIVEDWILIIMKEFEEVKNIEAKIKLFTVKISARKVVKVKSGMIVVDVELNKELMKKFGMMISNMRNDFMFVYFAY